MGIDVSYTVLGASDAGLDIKDTVLGTSGVELEISRGAN